MRGTASGSARHLSRRERSPRDAAGEGIGRAGKGSAPHPELRSDLYLWERWHLALCGLAFCISLASPAGAESFETCLAGLRSDAVAAGVPGAVFDDALRGVRSNPAILARTKQQGEFSQPIWSYLAGATSARRVAAGRVQAERWAGALAAAEAASGVDRAVILGIWGLESDFGTSTGGTYVVESLATLACANHRDGLFRDELVAALGIVARGEVASPRALRGSWAGAMGQTQFLPSSYEKYAVDGDGDGRRDIWGSAPDALASIGNFLKLSGWRPGVPWGFEVALPAGFDLKAHLGDRPFAEWRGAGVARADGEEWPDSGEGALWLPAGLAGPALLITHNFYVIKAYNTSDSYALAVGRLGDSILGSIAIHTAWPSGERVLTGPERIEMQTRLKARGFAIGKVDGKFGPETREAVRGFQLRENLPPDGYPSAAVLARLRGS